MTHLADPPEIIETCPSCGGEGTICRAIEVYEAGCGFSHPDVAEDVCPTCDGAGMFIETAKPDPLPFSEAEIERSQAFLADLLGEDRDAVMKECAAS
jgi:hypothetical protein